MIENREDLKRYLEMDRIALDKQGKRIHPFGDEIWRYEIILRKREYYSNCSKNIVQTLIGKYYAYRHHKMGMRLGIQIPKNVFGGETVRKPEMM